MTWRDGLLSTRGAQHCCLRGRLTFENSGCSASLQQSGNSSVPAALLLFSIAFFEGINPLNIFVERLHHLRQGLLHLLLRLLHCRLRLSQRFKFCVTASLRFSQRLEFYIAALLRLSQCFNLRCGALLPFLGFDHGLSQSVL